MNEPSRFQIVEDHVRRYFSGHAIKQETWSLGPILELIAQFRVLCVAPGERSAHWTYLSVGSSTIEKEKGGLLEFLIIAPSANIHHVELLAMAGWYHSVSTLGLGHTAPIGVPWLPGSLCDHFLVSRPYPFGPDLEVCNFGGGHIDFCWLLPITTAERDFKKRNGLESLEQRFDEAAIEYWNPLRPSVV